jgi:hypothetical protein
MSCRRGRLAPTLASQASWRSRSTFRYQFRVGTTGPAAAIRSAARAACRIAKRWPISWNVRACQALWPAGRFDARALYGSVPVLNVAAAGSDAVQLSLRRTALAASVASDI